MNNPFGNIQNMMGQLRGFMQNPAQYLMQQRLNIPQQFMSDPNQAIQYLMSNGKMTQQQYNQLQGVAKQIQNDPAFKQMIGNR